MTIENDMSIDSVFNSYFFEEKGYLQKVLSNLTSPMIRVLGPLGLYAGIATGAPEIISKFPLFGVFFNPIPYIVGALAFVVGRGANTLTQNQVIEERKRFGEITGYIPEGNFLVPYETWKWKLKAGYGLDVEKTGYIHRLKVEIKSNFWLPLLYLATTPIFAGAAALFEDLSALSQYLTTRKIRKLRKKLEYIKENNPETFEREIGLMGEKYAPPYLKQPPLEPNPPYVAPGE